jgi:hypothetical protein
MQVDSATAVNENHTFTYSDSFIGGREKSAVLLPSKKFIGLEWKMHD